AESSAVAIALQTRHMRENRTKEQDIPTSGPQRFCKMQTERRRLHPAKPITALPETKIAGREERKSQGPMSPTAKYGAARAAKRREPACIASSNGPPEANSCVCLRL